MKNYVVFTFHGNDGKKDYGSFNLFKSKADAVDCYKMHPKNRYFSLQEKAKILIKELEKYQPEIQLISLVEYLSLKRTPTNITISQLLRFIDINDIDDINDVEKKIQLNFLTNSISAAVENLFDFDFEKANNWHNCFFDSQPEMISTQLKRLRAIRDSVLCYRDIYTNIALHRIEFPPIFSLT